MSNIGGTGSKPVYTDNTPIVDNNAKPSSGASQGVVGAGLLQPSPNTTWVKGIVKKDAETLSKREAFIAANGKMGDRDQYLANQLDVAPNQQLPQVQQQAQQEESSAGLSRINTTVEDARDSDRKALDAEADHDKQVAEKNKEEIDQLRRQDELLRKKAEQLNIPQGTAPAA
jgi:hypothetical protein